MISATRGVFMSISDDPWVTLAGVRFRHKERRYGKTNSTCLSTAEGKTYRLASTNENVGDVLKYAHDVTLAGTTYQVFVAPTSSDVVKRLMIEPVDAGLGAPVILVAGEKRYALRRAPPLDSRPVNDPLVQDKQGLPPELTAFVARISSSRGVSPEAALHYILLKGRTRILADEKFEAKRKKRKK